MTEVKVWDTGHDLTGSKYAQVSDKEPLWFLFDGGNTDIKAMIHRRFGEEIVFPHMVRQMTSSEYANVAAAYSNRPSDHRGTAIFKYDGQGGYVVGKHATQVGSGQRIVGPGKYERNHYGAMLVAALLQLYPQSHPDVHVVALHPPRLDEANRRRMWKSLKGVHKIKTADGRNIEYNVTEIVPLEEPVAALQTFLFNTKGETYANTGKQLQPGDEVLVLDIGGGLSAFVPCAIDDYGNIDINLSDAPPIHKGIQNVIDIFEEELKAGFKELATTTRIPIRLMHDALVSGKIVIKGEEKDCKPQVANAMQAIVAPIADAYHNRYADGLPYSLIVVGGGGAASSFEFLKERVLEHPYVSPTEIDMTKIRFSAVRGASKGLIPFLASQGK